MDRNRYTNKNGKNINRANALNSIKNIKSLKITLLYINSQYNHKGKARMEYKHQGS